VNTSILGFVIKIYSDKNSVVGFFSLIGFFPRLVVEMEDVDLQGTAERIHFKMAEKSILQKQRCFAILLHFVFFI
jgi:hypothetical protein